MKDVETVEEELVELDRNGVPRIGGWLRLLMLSLALTVLGGLGDLFAALDALRGLEPEALEIAGPLLRFEAAGAGVAVCLGAWLLYLLYKRNGLFVKAYIGGMVAIHVLGVVNLVWFRSLVTLVPGEMAALGGRVALGIFVTGLWMWYLLVSRRVKQTCVR
ncbi:DUF2569 domain-containing protein [Pseudodesulfovibrio portus]|uniref:DUF2569 domain-containing protein n=1 Tax=Pseudodesulfovibrio portus TaxID=231439 RepID=A0ABM8AU42_9BACT|nr:DUF2569 domain-containing protein [Pseudodesulfovibrio portus]BDQ34766.1 hypothetical protein JCM14722_23080 [Pseudodesulfovibrio portus]